MEWFTRV